MRGYHIDIALTMPDEFHNVTLSGLFGNFNGNPLDDLISTNGEILDADSSEELIYRSFGETCMFIMSLGCSVQSEIIIIHDSSPLNQFLTTGFNSVRHW